MLSALDKVVWNLVRRIEYVCVAQLDRALGYGPRCREFESSHARTNPLESFSRGFFCFLLGSLPGQTLFYSSFAGNSYFSKSSHRPGFYVIM